MEGTGEYVRAFLFYYENGVPVYGSAFKCESVHASIFCGLSKAELGGISENKSHVFYDSS